MDGHGLRDNVAQSKNLNIFKMLICMVGTNNLFQSCRKDEIYFHLLLRNEKMSKNW